MEIKYPCEILVALKLQDESDLRQIVQLIESMHQTWDQTFRGLIQNK